MSSLAKVTGLRHANPHNRTINQRQKEGTFPIESFVRRDLSNEDVNAGYIVIASSRCATLSGACAVTGKVYKDHVIMDIFILLETAPSPIASIHFIP